MEHFSDDVDGILGALGVFLRGDLTGLDDRRLPYLLLKGYDLGLGVLLPDLGTFSVFLIGSVFIRIILSTQLIRFKGLKVLDQFTGHQ